MWRCIFATVIFYGILVFPTTSAPGKAFVTVENCRFLTAHVPADGVAYKAGVDVQGKPVASADLYPAPDFNLKDKIVFQLILDVAEESRGSEESIRQFQAHQGLEGRINLGKISLKDGKVMLEDKPLDQSQYRALIEFCRKSRNLP